MPPNNGHEGRLTNSYRRYENHAAFENHIGSKAFNKAKASLEDQQLLAKALEIMFVDKAFGL